MIRGASVEDVRMATCVRTVGLRVNHRIRELRTRTGVVAAHRQVRPAAATDEKNSSWGAERDVARDTYARMAMCVRTVGLRGDYMTSLPDTDVHPPREAVG